MIEVGVVRRVSVLCSVILVLLLTACGSRSVPSSSGASDYSYATTGGQPVDPATWKNPVGPTAQTLDSPSNAKLPFVPRIPAVARLPLNIVASANTSADELKEIGWAYDDPTIGKFVVVEAPVDYTRALCWSMLDCLLDAPTQLRSTRRTSEVVLPARRATAPGSIPFSSETALQRC